MYIWVGKTLLCPNSRLTWSTSCVLWYSIVPFQCRIRWKWILASRGFLTFLAIVHLAFMKLFWAFLGVVTPKILLCFFGRACSIITSLGDTLKILGNPCFSGVFKVKVLASVFNAVQIKRRHSPILIPVSLIAWSIVAVFFPHPAISWSISCSVGKNSGIGERFRA